MKNIVILISGRGSNMEAVVHAARDQQWPARIAAVISNKADAGGLDFAKAHLKAGGTFAAKVFQGEGSDEFLKNVRTSFDKVVVRKPAASRARSNEVYLVARGFKE